MASKSYEDQCALLDNLGLSSQLASSPLRQLAGLGSSGRNKNNITKELKLWLGEPNIPRPLVASAHILVAKPRIMHCRIQRSGHSFLLPHLVFAHMYHNDRATFNYRFLGPDGDSKRVKEFWSEVVRRKDPRIARHDMCKRRGWDLFAIPVALHGDAVPVTRVGRAGAKSLECFSWNSLLAFGPTLSIKLLIASIFEPTKIKANGGVAETMDVFWKIQAWSSQCLLEGVHPANDWTGRPYPEGSAEHMIAGQPLCSADEPFRAALWSLKGDLDWNCKSLGMKHYSALEPCDYCPANKNTTPDMWPTNFCKPAPWGTCVRLPQQWRTSVGPHGMIILFRALPYLSVCNVDADELHVLHLGVCQYFLGCVLWLLVFARLGHSPTANMSRVWDDILEAYDPGSSDHFTSLGLSSFINPKKAFTQYPRLSGRGCEVKSLIAPLMRVWAKHQNGSEHDEYVGDALSTLNHMVELLDDYSHEAFLPDADAAEFKTKTNKFLALYTILGNLANQQGRLLFSAVPKLHVLWHLADRARFLNPRRVSTYLDQDFVKHMKKVAAKCTAGTQLHKVPTTFMDRYCWGLTFGVKR